MLVRIVPMRSLIAPGAGGSIGATTSLTQGVTTDLIPPSATNHPSVGFRGTTCRTSTASAPSQSKQRAGRVSRVGQSVGGRPGSRTPVGHKRWRQPPSSKNPLKMVAGERIEPPIQGFSMLAAASPLFGRFLPVTSLPPLGRCTGETGQFGSQSWLPLVALLGTSLALRSRTRAG